MSKLLVVRESWLSIDGSVRFFLKRDAGESVAPWEEVSTVWGGAIVSIDFCNDEPRSDGYNRRDLENKLWIWAAVRTIVHSDCTVRTD